MDPYTPGEGAAGLPGWCRLWTMVKGSRAEGRGGKAGAMVVVEWKRTTTALVRKGGVGKVGLVYRCVQYVKGCQGNERLAHGRAAMCGGGGDGVNMQRQGLMQRVDSKRLLLLSHRSP